MSRAHEATPVVNVVVIALCAVLDEAESFYDIETFGQTKKTFGQVKKEWLAEFLDLKSGVPSHTRFTGHIDTFGRVFARLDPIDFLRKNLFIYYGRLLLLVLLGKVV